MARTGWGLQGRSLEHGRGGPSWKERQVGVSVRCSELFLPPGGAVSSPVELRLWSSSWEGRKPVGLGGLEGGRGPGAPPPAGGAAAAVAVAPGASKSPKASCHSLLNSSLDPGPGLSRSLRKAMSPRSPSSSSGLSSEHAGGDKRRGGGSEQRDTNVKEREEQIRAA